jgi:hypothetical protein
MDNKIWFSNINILFEKDTLFNIIPTSIMSNGEKINSITRFSLYLSLLLYLATGNYLYLYIILGTIVITYLIYIFNETEFFKNNMVDNMGDNDNTNDNMGDNTNDNMDDNTNKLCKKPTMENPLMNPLLGDNPYENNGACNIENNTFLEKIDKRFCNKLFQNTSSIFNNRNNQRAFYTVPSSGSVNDQTAFAKWLYNTPVSCEIGNNGLLNQKRGCAFNNKTLNEIKNEL